MNTQYWADPSKPYSFVPVTAFAEAFQKTEAAQRTRNVLDMPYDRAASPEGALVRPSNDLINICQREIGRTCVLTEVTNCAKLPFRWLPC